MIDKVMNFFWGNTPMSWMRYMTLYSFRKLNPDWKMTLYNTNHISITGKTWRSHEQQDFFNYTGPNFLSRIKDLDIETKIWNIPEFDTCSVGPSHKSNFFKWGYLSKNSGFYSDLDILFTKPIENYYEECKNHDVIICDNGKFFSIGFLGSSGNNRFFRDIYNNAFKTFDIERYQCVGVLNIYNYFKTLKIHEGNRWKNMIRYYTELKFNNHKMSLIYPWTSTKMFNVFEKERTKLPDNCIGIHWYAGDPLSQKYNNLISEDNYKQYKNTFSHFAEKVLQL